MSNISWMYRNLCSNPSAIVDIFGTSNSDFGTNRLADNNLQSYWEADRITTPSGTVVNILFDMGSSVNVDSLIVVHNMNETGTLYYMAGDTNPPTGTYSLPILGSTGTSMNFLTNSVNFRYWKLFANGTNLSEAIKLREIFIGKRDNFNVNPEYPFKREMDSSTIITISEKGQKKVYHKYTRTNWELSYSSIDEVTYGTMLKIRKFCSGSYKPFFVCFDIDDDKFATHFVRFGKNGFKNKEINHNIHDVSIRLEEEL